MMNSCASAARAAASTSAAVRWRPRRFLLGGGGVEGFVDAFGTCAREWAAGEDRGELTDGRRDQQHVRREREERAVGDVVVGRKPPAEREDGDLTERGDR